MADIKATISEVTASVVMLCEEHSLALFRVTAQEDMFSLRREYETTDELFVEVMPLGKDVTILGDDEGCALCNIKHDLCEFLIQGGDKELLDLVKKTARF